MRKGKYTEEDRKQAEAMLDDGLSYTEIASSTNWKVTALRRHFPNRGWTPVESGRHTQMMRRANREARKSGVILRGVELVR